MNPEARNQFILNNKGNLSDKDLPCDIAFHMNVDIKNKEEEYQNNNNHKIRWKKYIDIEK